MRSIGSKRSRQAIDPERLRVEGAAMALDQLRIFVAVAERQHVTHAAEALNLAQSAVSASIAGLMRGI